MKTKVSFFVLAIAGLLATPIRAEETTSFRQVVESHATAAIKSNDIDQMIQAAFALYPFERSVKPSESEYGKLLNKAAQLTLDGNEAKSAAQFLESVGPLSNAIAPEELRKLEDLARGATPSESVNETVGKVSNTATKYGPDFGNPEVKTRGEAEKTVAEAVAMAVLGFMRPSVVLADTEPYLRSHKWTSPRKNRIRLEASLRYYGALSDNPYDATVKVDFLVSDCLEVLHVGYSDTNILPCENLKNVSDVMDILNSALCK